MRKLSVMLVFDVPYAPPNDRDARDYMRGAEWRDERDVLKALSNLGHTVSAFGIYDRIEPLVEMVQRTRPDVIFNLCESFRSDRAHEPNLPALLELLNVPYTGARPESLSLCKDKGLTKKLLSYHHVRVPRFEVVPRHGPARRVCQRFIYPGICKPLGLDASEGIARSSLVHTAAACRERLRYIHDRLGSDAIIEEYIDGRELYVGVLGNERLTVLPPQELSFGHPAANTPRLLTFRAKWDDAYRRRIGMNNHAAGPLSPRTMARLQEMCRTVYRVCKISGYARLDLRLGPDDDLVLIEANPNPSIKRSDDFAQAVKRAGMSYEKLLGRLLQLALGRDAA